MRKIVSVIVIFNPDKSCVENIRLTSSQCSSIVIVNNGSENESVREIASLVSQCEGKIINNSANLGIATGFNIGIVEAIKETPDWIATFDQDSRIPPNYFTTLLDGYERLEDGSKIRIIAPVYYDPHSETTTSYAPISQQYLPIRKINVTISSGNLIKMETFSEIGFFLDDLFIDQVDTEFCLRIARAGLEVIEVRDACLSHSLGNQVTHKFMNRRPIVTNHSAERRYYGSRNRLYVYRKYLKYNKNWIFNDIRRSMKEIIQIVFFEKDRKRKLMCIIQGVMDGIAGRYGPYEKNHRLFSSLKG